MECWNEVSRIRIEKRLYLPEILPIIRNVMAGYGVAGKYWPGRVLKSYRGIKMDILKLEEFYTINDIYALPNGERAELIDGQIYYIAPPGRNHQKISGYLYHEIYDYIKKNNGACEVYSAPFAVLLNKDDINYVEPDISVICDLSKLDDKGCNGAPDWVIEIVSPGSISRDYMVKLFKYRAAGVREYWIVDPDKRMVMVYGFERNTAQQYSFGEAVPSGIYEGFNIML